MDANEKISKSVIDDQHPYLGLSSFLEVNQQYFYGRTEEISLLMKMVKHAPLTVLFGRSGLGKTSLLKAGLFPVMRKTYFLPIYVRLNLSAEFKVSPLKQVKMAIEEKIKEIDGSTDSIGDMTLWEYFHRTEFCGGMITPVLVFDQFEEVFTLGKHRQKEINVLITELANLIENRVPLQFQEVEEDPSHIDYRSINFRIVFSLREDYLAELENYSAQIPNLKKVRLRLLQMNGERALEAVYEPAKLIIEKPEAMQIVNLIIASGIDDGRRLVDQDLRQYRLEPFLLSLICERINRKRFAKDGSMIYPKITNDLLQDISLKRIIRDLYADAIADYDDNVAAFIETKLLTLDGHRRLLPISDALAEEGVTRQIIDDLVDKRLLRKEIWNGREQVELIHDVLVKEVRTRKLIRERNIQKEEFQKEFQRQKDVQQRDLKVKRLRKWSVFISVVALIILSGWALALQNYRNAKRNNTSAKAGQLALRAQLSEYGNEKSMSKSMLLRLKSILLAEEAADISTALEGYQLLSQKQENLLKPKFILQQNDTVVNFLISKNQKHLVSHQLNSISVWDVQQQEIVRTFPISSASDLVPVKSPRNGFIFLEDWNMINFVGFNEISRPVKIEISDSVEYFSYNNESEKLVVLTKNAVQIWDLQKNLHRQEPRTWIGPSVIFSPNGKYGTNLHIPLSIKNILDQKLTTPDYLAYECMILEFSDDGTCFACLDYTERLMVLKTQEQKILYSMPGVQHMQGLKFSSSNNLVAFVDSHNHAIIVNLHNQQQVSKIALSWPFSKMAFDHTDQLLAVSYRDRPVISIFDISTGLEIFQCNHEATVNAISFDQDSSWFISSGQDKKTVIWDMEKDKLSVAFTGKKIAFSDNGRFFAAAGPLDSLISEVYEVKVFETHRGKLEHLVRMPANKKINSIALNFSGEILAVCSSKDFYIYKLLDLKRDSLLFKVDHDQTIDHVIIGPNTKYIFTASDKKSHYSIWDLEKGIESTLQDQAISGAQFNNSGNLFISYSNSSNQINVIDLATMTNHTLQSEAPITTAAFTFGTQITCIDSDGRLTFWDAQSGKLSSDHPTVLTNVKKIVYNQDINHMLVCHGSNIVRVFEMTKNYDLIEKMQLSVDSNWDQILFHGNNHSIVYSVNSTASKTWVHELIWKPEVLKEKICMRLPSALSISEWESVLPDDEYSIICSESKFNTTYLEAGREFARRDQIKAARKVFTYINTIVDTFDIDAELNYYRALGKVEIAHKYARTGKIKEASKLFYEASKLDQKVISNPEAETNKFVAELREKEGLKLAYQGQIEEAVTKFNQAIQLDTEQQFDPQSYADDIYSGVLIRRGESDAKAGNISSAMKYFDQANSIKNDTISNPEGKANEIAFKSIMAQAELLASTGTVDKAISLYQQAIKLQSGTIDISAEDWNTLCWYGNIWGRAVEVRFACDSAVAKAENNLQVIGGIRDSRGLGRALLGDIDGAIEDFEFYVEWSTGRRPEERLQKRKEWIEDLTKGKNPFDQVYLNKLRWD